MQCNSFLISRGLGKLRFLYEFYTILLLHLHSPAVDGKYVHAPPYIRQYDTNRVVMKCKIRRYEVSDMYLVPIERISDSVNIHNLKEKEKREKVGL